MPTDTPDTEAPNVFSIQSRRTQSNLRVRRGMLTTEERIAELEVDVDKLVSLCLQQQRTIEEMEDRQWKLLRLIGKRLGLSGRATQK